MSLLRGGGTITILGDFLVVPPPKSRRRKLEVREVLGADRRMFAGSEQRASMCWKSCWAAWAESKLSPTICLWSAEFLIVWKVGEGDS